MNWEHPKGYEGYRALYEGYTKAKTEWLAYLAEHTLEETTAWWGRSPDQDDYMPEWTEEEAVGWQMYETTSEGTPISPVCSNPEELAHWLADNEANAFGGMTASYDQWLRTITRGSAPSAVIQNGQFMSGVAAS